MSNGAKSRALTVMALPWTAAAFKHNPGIAGLRAKPSLDSGPCKRDLGFAIAAPVDLYERRGPDDLAIGALFQHGDGAFISPPPVNRGSERPFPETLTIGRIAEDEIEWEKRASRAELRRIAPPDLGDAGEPQGLDIAAHGTPRRGVVLDEHGIARPA